MARYERQRDPRINYRIRIPKVRLIDQEGNQVGVVETREALRKAQEAGQDLVEVSPKADPPVCRIMDFGKFKYDKKKKETEARKKQHATQLKEVRISPKIQEHDMMIKVEKAREFLGRGDKVLVSMMFKGREMAHTDIGRHVMETFVKELEEEAKVEIFPKMDRRKLTLILAPNQQKQKKKKG